MTLVRRPPRGFRHAQFHPRESPPAVSERARERERVTQDARKAQELHVEEVQLMTHDVQRTQGVHVEDVQLVTQDVQRTQGDVQLMHQEVRKTQGVEEEKLVRH